MKHALPFKLASIAVAACLIETAAFADVLPGAAMPEQVSRSLRQQQMARQRAAPAVTPVQNDDQGAAAPLSPEIQKLKFNKRNFYTGRLTKPSTSKPL